MNMRDLRAPTALAALPLVLVFLALLPATLSAQLASASALNHAPPRTLAPNQALAVRAEPAAPHLDGRLDEAVWRTAPAIGHFVQRDPHQGDAPTERTEAHVLYTDDAIYVGVRAWDTHATGISARLTRRDEDSPSDWIYLGIDSYHDRRTAFVFGVNPAGVKMDEYMFDDGNEDKSWDAVWDVATSVDSAGWTAEFRIPFSQLRFSQADRNTFGFQIVRTINRLNEEDHWQLMRKGEPGTVSKFGELVGIQGIKPPRRIEVMPYTAASSAWYPAESGNPFADGSDQHGRAGADLKVGVTSNLTLSATINPDFGQVEADPAVVNLSAFETFYPEKRPFFSEGLDIFRFPILLGDGDNANEQLFYTRRIGRAPQGEADARGGYAQQIDQTTILGAGKLSGKTASGWTVGLLGAMTAEERAQVLGGDGSRYSDVVEPRTGYFVGRLAKDFRGGLTKAGFFGTAVTRALPDNLQWLRNGAYAGGFDLHHRFLKDTYEIGGWIVGSYVTGSAEAIDETQRSSARYFQRPDNTHVTYDPTRTSLAGFAGQLVFSRNKGNVQFATGADTRSPGFEVNDAGYQREADRTIQFVWVGIRQYEPSALLRSAGVNFNQYSTWSYGWERLGIGGNINGNVQFLNYWNAYAGFERSLSALQTAALRGGPAILRPPTWNWWGGFSSDGRKALSGWVSSWGFSQPESGAWGYGVGPGVSWQAASNVDFNVGPQLNRQYDSWQYLDTQDALGNTHYVFGKLRQTTVSMTARGNVTFRPNLSLQVYAEPFIATGRYEGYREVADPRGARFADRFTDYTSDQVLTAPDSSVSIDLNRDGTGDFGLGDPNFTVLSFRSNVVLRWEYVLGSTLFVVWQHGRFDANTNPNFDLGTGVRDLFRLPAQNTVVVKLNYWLSL